MAFMALRILRMSMIVVKEFTQPVKRLFIHIAKNNNFFRKYICKPPAYGYEWCENTLHMLITKDKKFEPLTEEEVINLGSAIWAEVVVFIGCSKVLLLETNRQAKHKETTDKEFLKQEQNITEAVEVLQNILKQQQFYIEQIIIVLKELVLPILKLAILGMRQIARPVSNFIRKEAKQSKFFRDYICMPPAQGFHWCEVTIKMLLMNLGRPAKVEPLNQAMAIELGAEILGELIVFIIAAGGLIFETARQAKKKNLEMSSINVHSLELVEALKVLEYRQKRQMAYIQEIAHALAELNKPISVKKIKKKEFEEKQEELFKNMPVEYLFD